MSHASESLDRHNRHDELCDRFERQWLAGESPRIEDALADSRSRTDCQSVRPEGQTAVPEIDREQLLRELLLVELELRKSNGESPAAAEYETRFPDDATVIAEAFEASDPDAGSVRVALHVDSDTVNTSLNPNEETDDPDAAVGRIANPSEETHVPAAGRIGNPSYADPDATYTFVPDRDTTATSQGFSEIPGMGKRFGDYELLHEIARGGMGVVYKARQTRLNRIVALKMIRSGELAGPDEVQRFHAEAEAAAQLDHPNIVPIYEVGEQNGQHFFSMGFVEGRGLDARLKDGPLPPKEAVEVIRTIAEAIHYAHDKGIVHRDLKPANVLIDVDGKPRITDFGLAKTIGGDSGMTATGQVMGTPSYMPPEQAAGKTEQIGPLADVYSLGAMLYALLTGRPPFQAANVVETLKQVLEQEPVSPRVLNPAVDKDLETICLKTLEKDPHGRYTSARGLADDLGRYLAGKPIAARPIGAAAKLVRWCRRNPLGAMVVSLLAILAIGGPIVAISQSRLSETAQREKIRADEKVVELNQTNNRLIDSLAAETKAKTLAALKETEAKQQEQIARLQLYASHIKAAQNAWDNHDLPLMLHHLRNCDARLRGWEHAYLKRTLFANQQTIDGRGGSLRTVSVSPGGDLIVTGGANGEISIRNCSTGRLIRRWAAHQTDVLDIAISHDGRRMASVSLDGTLKLSEIPSGKQLFVVEQGRYSCVCFSSEGSRFFAGTANGGIHIWDANTHKSSEHRNLSSSRITSIACSPDGRLLVAATAGNSLLLWDAIEKKTSSTLKGHTDWVTSVAFSPDGRRIASTADDATVRIWDVASAEEIVSLAGHTGTVETAIFVANGKQLASAASDGTVRIWDVGTGQELQTFVGHLGAVYSLAASLQDNTVISTGADGSIRRWSLAGYQGPLVVKPHSQKVAGIAFSPRGDRIATASWDETIKVLQTSDGRVVSAPRGLRQGAKDCILFVAGGTRMIYGTSTGGLNSIATPGGADSAVRRADHASGYQAAITADGTKLFTFDRNDFKILEVSTFRVLRQFSKQRLDVTSIACHPDSETIAAPCRSGVIAILNSTTGKRLMTQSGHSGVVHRVAYSPDGSRLFSAGADGTLKVWDTSTGKELQTLHGHSAAVTSVIISPDGTRLISSGKDNTVRIWHPETGTLLCTLRGRSPIGECLAIHHRGRWIATGGGDGTVTIWHGDQNADAESEKNTKPDRENEWVQHKSLDALNQSIPVADFDFLAAARRSKQALRAATNATNAQRAVRCRNLGLLYSQRGMLLRSEFYLRRSCQYQPDYRASKRQLGAVLLRQGRSSDGRMVLREVLQQYLDEILRQRRQNPATAHRAIILKTRLQREFPSTLESQVDGDQPPEGIIFDGENEFCIVPSLYFNGRPSWTIEAIVSPLKPSRTWATVAGTLEAGGIGLSMSSQIWRYTLYTGRLGFNQVASYSRANAETPWESGKIYHVAGVWDGKDLRLYVNGTLRGINRGVKRCTRLAGFPFFIGADPSISYVAQAFFGGRIYSVRISNSAVYDKQFSPPARLLKSTNTVALYEFRSSMHFYVPDLSGNRHHAHLIRAPRKHLSALLELANNGRHRMAISLADRIGKQTFSAGFYYELTCALSASANVAILDKKLEEHDRKHLADAYVTRAIAILKGLVRVGFFKTKEYRALLFSDQRLAPLRRSDEFRKVAQAVGVDVPLRARKPKSATNTSPP